MKNGILTAGLVVALFAVAASMMAHPQIYSVTPQQGGKGATGSSGSSGTAATIAAGTISSLPTGSTPTINNSGSSSAAVFNFAIPVGLTGSQGISGAGWIPAKLTTNTSGAITWTFPAGCIGSGNAPAIVYAAEGPNPAGTTSVNVQTVGTVGVTTVGFQVTKQTATTVALIGLTIAVTASGTGVGATIIDVGCLAQ